MPTTLLLEDCGQGRLFPTTVGVSATTIELAHQDIDHRRHSKPLKLSELAFHKPHAGVNPPLLAPIGCESHVPPLLRGLQPFQSSVTMKYCSCAGLFPLSIRMLVRGL